VNLAYKNSGISISDQEFIQFATKVETYGNQIIDALQHINKKQRETVKDIALLPVAKKKIQAAIKLILGYQLITKDKERYDELTAAYLSLGQFQEIAPEDREVFEESLHRQSRLKKQTFLASLFRKLEPDSSPESYNNSGQVEVAYRSLIEMEQESLREDLDDFIYNLFDYIERKGQEEMGQLRTFAYYLAVFCEEFQRVVKDLIETNGPKESGPEGSEGESVQ
jgi:hypothetical protein